MTSETSPLSDWLKTNKVFSIFPITVTLSFVDISQFDYPYYICVNRSQITLQATSLGTRKRFMCTTNSHVGALSIISSLKFAEVRPPKLFRVLFVKLFIRLLKLR